MLLSSDLNTGILLKLWSQALRDRGLSAIRLMSTFIFHFFVWAYIASYLQICAISSIMGQLPGRMFRTKLGQNSMRNCIWHF